jgi:hypothetical protein
MIAVQVGLKGQHDFLSPGLCALRCIFPVRFKFRERIYWRSSKYVATSPVALLLPPVRFGLAAVFVLCHT